MAELRSVVSAEHAGNELPRRWAPHFEGLSSLLASHRGWDPGSAELAEDLAEALGAPLIATRVSRLLVEVNRSPHHPRLFSEVTRGLPALEREEILETLYRPHRERVLQAVSSLRGRRCAVLHLGVHSFTPVLGGRDRRCDAAILYDPRRPRKRAFAEMLMVLLGGLRSDLRLRRNYPYRGNSDGLTTSLRRIFPPESYLGIELEVSQRFPLSSAEEWAALRASLVEAMRSTVERFAQVGS